MPKGEYRVIKIQLSLLFLSLTMLAMNASGQSKIPDSDAKILSSPEFKLSEAVDKAGIDGTVLIAVNVNESGDVKSAEILSGPAWPCGQNPKKELDEIKKAVKESVLASKFSPAINDGKPHASFFWITYKVGEAYQALLRKRAEEDAIKKGIAPPQIIKGGVLNGRALRLPRPEYPQLARRQHLFGSVAVEILIDEHGKVILAGAVNGPIVFQFEARNAACGAKFTPTLLSGNPVKVSGLITYHFSP